MPTKYETFVFQSYRFDPTTGELRMAYAFENGPSFEEVIVFPLSARSLTAAEDGALDKIFRLIFLLCGISYYKAFVPEDLRCEAFALDKATASLMEKIYVNGLGEFAFRNGLSLVGKIRFRTEKADPGAAATLGTSKRLLVPVGGGKDSIVTMETLRRAGQDVTLFALSPPGGPAAPIARTIEASRLPSLAVTRALSENLFELNKAGAYNGHVPITAILSCIALASAVLHGHGAVVMSNEHSASAPNVRLKDLNVNHQYSKSLAFETDLAAYLQAYVATDLAYFSFLRPLTEAEIARRFAKETAYHDLFQSCNAAFRQTESHRLSHWCGNCPKCRFVFLALAPFIEKRKLVTLFASNLLGDPRQVEGFKELCGLSAHKPFECVGEIEESVLLIQKLYRMRDWAEDVVVCKLGAETELDDAVFETRFAHLFAARHPNRLSPVFLEILDAAR